MKPTRRTEGVVVTELMDEVLVYDLERHRAHCLNPPAARSFLPLIIKKTEWILAGRSKAQISEDLQAAFDQKDLLTLELGAMSYMQSKQGNLNDSAGRWHPHVMFFVPLAEAQTWGANLPGSPMLATEDAPERMTIFMVPVAKWSDGTPDSSQER